MQTLRRVGWWFLALLFACPIPVGATPLQANCQLCIVEIQTQGVSSATDEYIVIKNRTTSDFDLTGVVVKYFTSAGNPNTKTISLSGLVAPQAELAFVSDSLKTSNPTHGVFPAGLAMSDTGGTIQIISGTNVLDQVGWGTATLSEDVPATAHGKGYSLVRQTMTGITDDIGNNSVDFTAKPQACFGVSLNEIQPFSIDLNGDDIDPFIEILVIAQSNKLEDCPIEINGTTYSISSGDIASGSLVAITQVLNSSSLQVALPILSGAINNIRFFPESLFGAVNNPGASLSQPILITGQSLAKFGTSWKPTYSITPDASNIFSSTLPVSGGTISSDPLECESVLMTEIFPNAIGEDSGNEWIELFNESTDTKFLGNCKVLVNTTEYGFNPDQFLEPGEYMHFTDFIDVTSVKTVSLRNTDVNTVSFGRKVSGGVFGPIQTIQYENAPEGQSWSRFNDGWRWSDIPTPSAPNQLSGKGSDSIPITEFAAITGITGGDQELFVSAPLQITELLPNPAAPATDENDEYVELYNPTPDPVNLTGYKVQTGSNYTYSFTLTDQIILPGSYLVLTSGTTNLTLSNTAGRARLLDPNGAVVSETDPYTDAEEGNAWTFLNGVWQWSSTPTPATANIITAPIIKTSKAKTASAKTKKATKTKATKAKATAKPKAANPTNNFADADQPGKLHPSIIAGVGLLAVGYAAYEYRRDIANRFYQLKRYRANRRTSGR